MQVLTKRSLEENKNLFRAFVDKEVIPYASDYDKREYLPHSLLEKMAEEGYLCSMLPEKYGGKNHSNLDVGLLNEEFGRGCASSRSLLTVHGMVGLAIYRWGTKSQRNYWLPQMTKGTIVGAFALTEPNAGSDARNISTDAKETGNSYLINGVKKWITMGQIADVFLVFANVDGQPSVFLVPSDTDGITITPINNMLGAKASMLAEIHFKNCTVPKENLIGRVGIGLSHIALSCLDYGRYTIASGCVGAAQACLESSVKYASNRGQYGVLIKDHQLIRKMITEMSVNIEAARQLCQRAGQLREELDPQSILATWQAKYYSSTMLQKIVSDAIQVHGANGCTQNYVVERHYRDSKINEIIEGSTQIHEIMIAEQVCNQFS
ncbi:acyl-CoA dehydrogenase family protein [Bacillus cereus group sp. MYBK108-2]|uniref:acyl-CoA dehydrogenase family protein n=1 Tax=unclassified Bacillus cereus group TaxID=2750818 RepID=UPI002890A01C|nr:acyl-CoA dehydrogenase family protein [Bacillus cereus]MDA2307628.1 acyl-CoA dehydrogenase family protein [Bacillus cereus]HDX9634239.1 acyl-CoA dehydrogenase family protein [Bacillus cereus]HEF1897126.1 acyl-CoA dehydrogenase family protein [Bacillus cereus]